jgi:cytochrome c oxidase subunit 3
VKQADIDVSSLPAHTLDHRSPIWWGNTLLLVIESVMFGILIASYFYLYKNFSVWPPVRTAQPEAYYTRPELHWGTINLIVMLF